jgi:hypothetical protein
MGKVQLVEQDIKDGERVVDAVAAEGNLSAALWLYDGEAGTYQLMHLRRDEVGMLQGETAAQGRVTGGVGKDHPGRVSPCFTT